MTPDELRAEIDRLRPWFHRIDLGGGLVTKTESVMGEPVDHPARPWRTIGRLLPEDLHGRSVLDVGCNAGFYAIEAKRRGATRVLGVDGQRQHVRQALFVRRALGIDVEFRRMDVYELTRRSVGTFDVTLALGLVYHLKHLVLALERLFEVTKDLLIVETQVMPAVRGSTAFDHPFGSSTMALSLLAFVENLPDAKEQVHNWFLPSPEALAALLRNTGFAEVELYEVRSERAILLARKQPRSTPPAWSCYLARLTIVAAPNRISPGESFSILVRIDNESLALWPAHGEGVSDAGAVRLGAHLLRPDGEEVSWDYGRAALPRDLGPGDSIELTLDLRAPSAAGDYVVELDLVAEQRTWFEDHGAGTVRQRMTVE